MKTKEIEFDAEQLVRNVEAFRDHVTGKRKIVLRKTTLSSGERRQGKASKPTPGSKEADFLIAREQKPRYRTARDGRRTSS
jgi:hypothetical protein